MGTDAVEGSAVSEFVEEGPRRDEARRCGARNRGRRRAVSARRYARQGGRSARPRRASRPGRPARDHPRARPTLRRAPRRRSAEWRGRRRAPHRCGCRHPNRPRAREAVASACSRLRRRSARVMRVSLVPMVKTSAVSAARVSACAKARCASVRSFIEPDMSIRSTMRRWRARRLRWRRRTNSPALRMASRNMRRASVSCPPRAARHR